MRLDRRRATVPAISRALDKADVRLDVRVVSDDGALVTVLGLDPLHAGRRSAVPPHLNVAASGRAQRRPTR